MIVNVCGRGKPQCLLLLGTSGDLMLSSIPCFRCQSSQTRLHFFIMDYIYFKKTINIKGRIFVY